ncbi:hypothetical protein GX48_04182 [Paracoccidioides brasiliensis]|nr:hypothetical protein GX48_04182 [Paracoccidioides brasiliensis]
MPRATRVALRRNNIHDLKDPTKSIEGSNNTPTSCCTRNTLGEITGNRDYDLSPLVQASIPAELKQRLYETSTQKPTEEAAGVQIKRPRSIRDLVNPEDLGIKVFRNITSSDPMLPLSQEQDSPKSQALGLSPPRFGQTPRFDPAVHKSPVMEALSDQDQQEDSFLQSIVSQSHSNSKGNDKWVDIAARPTPAMPQPEARNYQDIEDPLDAIDALEDALEQIGQALPVVEEHALDSPERAGTPVDGIILSGAANSGIHPGINQKNGTEPGSKKQIVSRQQQCVDDNGRPQAREQKMSQSLLLSAQNRQSSLTTSRSIKGPDRSVSKRAHSVPEAAKSAPNSRRRSHPKLSSNIGSNDAKLATTRPSICRKSSHPSLPSGTVSTHTLGTSKPRSNSTIISSLAKPAFTPSKSTKTPTRPTFELPGEAISRRQRAQWEERLKREEEELQRRREFKARTARNFTTPAFPVKETIASRIRATLKAEEVQNRVSSAECSRNAPSVQPKRSSLIMPIKTSSLRTNSIGSTGSNRTPSGTKAIGNSTSASSAAPGRPLAPNGTNRSLNRNGSRSEGKDKDDNNEGAISPVCTVRTPVAPATRTDSNTLLTQRLRGKEIFARDRVHEIERGRERKEKEEAAKRARTEAAERGRLASREWAERQKMRLKSMTRNSQTDMKRG